MSPTSTQEHPHPPPRVSPADLLEDVVSADILDVLLYYRASAIFLCQLLLQPFHQILVVVPNIGLPTDDACLDTRAQARLDTLTRLHPESALQKLTQRKEAVPSSPLLLALQEEEAGLKAGAFLVFPALLLKCPPGPPRGIRAHTDAGPVPLPVPQRLREFSPLTDCLVKCRLRGKCCLLGVSKRNVRFLRN